MHFTYLAAKCSGLRCFAREEQPLQWCVLGNGSLSAFRLNMAPYRSRRAPPDSRSRSYGPRSYAPRRPPPSDSDPSTEERSTDSDEEEEPRRKPGRGERRGTRYRQPDDSFESTDDDDASVSACLLILLSSHRRRKVAKLTFSRRISRDRKAKMTMTRTLWGLKVVEVVHDVHRPTARRHRQTTRRSESSCGLVSLSSFVLLHWES